MSSPHGKFRVRIGAGDHETDCSDGYTMWHLLAAGLLTQSEVESFLRKAKTIHQDQLLDDLREKMTVFPYYIAWRYQIQPTPEYNFDQFRALTGFRSPREICRLRAMPFLAEYFVSRSWLHPVVESFRLQTKKDLGLNSSDVPPLH